tara:strand:- start:280 stop:474 length:195 start_codon:yes stop_codon:yes gene_type:complete
MFHKTQPGPARAVFPRIESFPAFPFPEYWDFGQAPEPEAEVESPRLLEEEVAVAGLERQEHHRD